MRRIIQIAIFVLIFTIVRHVYGQASTIKINEFLIEPTPQMVELLNTGSEIVNLSNWFIDDNGGTTFFTIPEGTQLYPNACLSLSGSFNLNRTSVDSIRLFDATAPPTSLSAHLIDLFEYKASSGSGVTYQRVPDGSDVWATGTATLNKYNITGQSCVYIPPPTPTPTATEQPSPTTRPIDTPTPSPFTPIATSTPIISPTTEPTPTAMLSPTAIPRPTLSPTPTPEIHAVYLSEVYPYPNTDEHEWLELYNDNSSSITLDNWKLDDIANGGSSPKKFTITIPGYSFGVIDLSGPIFNNDADTVRLLDATDHEIESFSYDGVEKLKSIARQSFTSNVFCLQNPTHGYSNGGCIDTDQTPTPTSTPTPLSTPTSTPGVGISRAYNKKENNGQILGLSLEKRQSRKRSYSIPVDVAGSERTPSRLPVAPSRQHDAAIKRRLFQYSSSATLITSFLTAGWIFIRIIL